MNFKESNAGCDSGMYRYINVSYPLVYSFSHLILLSLQPLHVLKFLSLQGLNPYKQLLCFVPEVHKT